MSKHRKAQGHKPPGDKKQKSNGKKEVPDTKEVKDKIVAAETVTQLPNRAGA